MELQQKQHKKGLFKKEKTHIDISLREDIASLSRRLRILEERYANFRARIQVLDQNMILHNKKQTTDIKTINSDISDLKNEINEINEKVELIIKELKNMASKEDVEVLKKYIDLWNPMNFVTRKEVMKFVKEVK